MNPAPAPAFNWALLRGAARHLPGIGKKDAMKDERQRPGISEWFGPEASDNHEVPLAASGVHAGFPSPAEDHIERRLDLNDLVVKHPEATFFARVEGDSMKDECIEDGDLIVVDKAVRPYDGCLAVAFIDGEFTLKRLRIHDGRVSLVPANGHYPIIEVTADNDFTVWGVVEWIVKRA